MMSGFASLLAAFAVATAATPEPPRGPNGAVLGTADEYAMRGPARVCLIQTSIDLQPGETAFADYLGFHHGGLRVVGPAGAFHLSEGNAWAEPKGGKPVIDPQGRRVELHHDNGHPRYLIYAPASFDRDRAVRPLVWVEGDVLQRSGPKATLARINVGQDDPGTCDRRYFYGMDGFGQVRRARKEER